MKLKLIPYVFVAFLLLVACGRVKVPTEYIQSDQLPSIYPDYIDVTVPVNVAPLTFMLDIPDADMIARYRVGAFATTIVLSHLLLPARWWDAVVRMLGKVKTPSK